MGKAAWPTSDELTARLTGLGLSAIPDGLDAEVLLGMAVEALENATNCSPFLVEAEDSTVLFDAPDTRWLDLKTRYVSVTSVSLSGSVMTEGQDYYLQPAGGPYTSLRTMCHWCGLPQCVEVVGARGNKSDIPFEVWQAVLDKAAATAFRTAIAKGTVKAGAVTMLQQDVVKMQFGSGNASNWQSTADELDAKADAVFLKYTLPAIGGL